MLFLLLLVTTALGAVTDVACSASGFTSCRSVCGGSLFSKGPCVFTGVGTTLEAACGCGEAAANNLAPRQQELPKCRCKMKSTRWNQQTKSFFCQVAESPCQGRKRVVKTVRASCRAVQCPTKVTSAPRRCYRFKTFKRCLADDGCSWCSAKKRCAPMDMCRTIPPNNKQKKKKKKKKPKTMTPPTNTMSTPTNSMSMTPPNSMSMTAPNSMSMTPPNSMSMTPPNSMSMTPPNSMSMTPPNSMSMTPPNSMSMTPPNSMSMTPPNSMSMTPPNSMSMTPPNSMSMTPPNSMSMTPPNSMSMTPPNSMSMTAPNSMSMTPPNSMSMTPPNSMSMTPPNSMSMSSPTPPNSMSMTNPFTVPTAPPSRLGNDPSCRLGRCKDARNCPNPDTEDKSLFQKVCINSGTERAYTGELLEPQGTGVYKCSCCGQPLFHSATKFDSKTGWPSFYAPFNSSAVTEDVDFDIGYPRTEVKCANCGAHLGHVFPDGPAPTGDRYCINSVCMDFEHGHEQHQDHVHERNTPAISSVAPASVVGGGDDREVFQALLLQLQQRQQQQQQFPFTAATATASSSSNNYYVAPEATTTTAVFAGGCFWGVELAFEFVKGVVDVRSGYAGGTAQNADYKTVTSGRTNHAEAVEIVFDPSVVSFKDLLRIFFLSVHDPTTLNYQKPDTGRWYRSAVFYAGATQRREAEEVIRAVTGEVIQEYGRPIVTEVTALSEFYPAEAYHQDFATRNPTHAYIVAWDLHKLDDVQEDFPAFFNSAKARPAR